MNLLRLAFTFLTVLPVRLKQDPQPGDLGRAATFYPLVGLVIGALLAVAAWLLQTLFGGVGLLAPVLLTACWALLTGGLHLDGVADCGDGLLAAVSRERRLEIMRDPRMGAFGGITLLLQLLIKITALGVLFTLPWSIRLPALLAAPTLARWLIVLAARQPMARPGGLGNEFALGVTWRTVAAATLVPLLLLPWGTWHGLIAVAFGLIALAGLLSLARARLGGITGDVLGLVVEVGESAVLLAFVMQLPF